MKLPEHDCPTSFCRVCGENKADIDLADLPALRQLTPSCCRLCQYTYSFVQGVVLGHLISVLTSCNIAKDESQSNTCRPTRSEKKKQVCDRVFAPMHGHYVKTESKVWQNERDPDVESSRSGELWQGQAGLSLDPECCTRERGDQAQLSFQQQPSSGVTVSVSVPHSSNNHEVPHAQLYARSSQVTSQPTQSAEERNASLSLEVREGKSCTQQPVLKDECITQQSQTGSRYSPHHSSTEKVIENADRFVKDCAHVNPVSGTRVRSKKRKERSNTARQSNQVECGQCGKNFLKSHLSVHMRFKHSDAVNKEADNKLCDTDNSNKTCDSKLPLNKWFVSKHCSDTSMTKSCTVCQKTFASQNGLSMHMRQTHQTTSPKQCDLCHKSFQSSKELNRHKLHDHKLRVHVCHLCGKNFAYGNALKSHLDAHAGVKKHFCEICGEGFVRMTSLCGHRVSAHSKKDTVFPCMVCASVFSTKALLNKHLFECHLTGPYAVKDYKRQLSIRRDLSCDLCKATGSTGPCSHHDKDDKPQFICSHCGKKFSRSHYLKAHEKQHQVARFSCDICCKRFTYKCNLKVHRSTHSSDKPYQCPVCQKTFRLKLLLEEHQRLHNQDSLYKCYVCGRGLTRIPNLKRHIKVMHPEVSYEQQFLDMHQNNDGR